MATIAFVGNHWTRKGGDQLLRWHQARWPGRAEWDPARCAQRYFRDMLRQTAPATVVP